MRHGKKLPNDVSVFLFLLKFTKLQLLVLNEIVSTLQCLKNAKKKISKVPIINLYRHFFVVWVKMVRLGFVLESKIQFCKVFFTFYKII